MNLASTGTYVTYYLKWFDLERSLDHRPRNGTIAHNVHAEPLVNDNQYGDERNQNDRKRCVAHSTN